MGDDNNALVVRAAKNRANSTPDTEQQDPYKVLCISMYASDIAQLEKAVAELKSRGIRRANKSWLIRVALSRLDIKTVTTEDRP